MKVWLVDVQIQGENRVVRVCATRERAKAWLAAYCKKRWHQQDPYFGPGLDEPPDDPDELIREYFQHGFEHHEIDEMEVLS